MPLTTLWWSTMGVQSLSTLPSVCIDPLLAVRLGQNESRGLHIDPLIH